MKVPLSEIQKGDFINMIVFDVNKVAARVPFRVDHIKTEHGKVWMDITDRQGRKRHYGFLDPELKIERADGFVDTGQLTEFEHLQNKLATIREICDLERPDHIKVFKIKEILEGVK
ncbi:hypothetical protein QNH23_06340 [Siminovitchia fortis]|uniref:Uncharacterized protein n=1 Tax=Siminovitchia fortis TaxID=254758 RepID=A0A443IM38_9BACI|nr:hypothetical protein [Siminovitchia fortis]RWR06724.1 hypothetical protein D4N35_013745 [Siminovitchia fortis]WHY82990.1 hypothetical protein QNH23_06340 [Siminovitchia fortis]